MSFPPRVLIARMLVWEFISLFFDSCEVEQKLAPIPIAGILQAERTQARKGFSIRCRVLASNPRALTYRSLSLPSAKGVWLRVHSCEAV